MNFTADFLSQAEKTIGDFFRSQRGTLIKDSGSIATQFKADESVVTKLDEHMEIELKKVLEKFDSSIGYEGEEFGPSGNRQTFWLVDPIDGTESFVRGLPFYRNMASLIDNGRPVFSIVYRVTTDEMFVAKKGLGTYKDGMKLSVSQRPLHRVRVELAVHYEEEIVWPVLKELEKLIENFRTADEFLYVAEAKLDAHLVYKCNTKPWDNAARMLILEETGAKVANIGSDTYDYMGGDWLAASPNVYGPIVKCIMETAGKNS